MRIHEADYEAKIDRLRNALEGLLRIHTEPVNWRGKYGKELDALISEQQIMIDARVSAAKAVLEGMMP